VQDPIRLHRSISISFAFLVVVVVGLTMDLSLKHAREQLESAVSLLTRDPWSPNQPNIWHR
jgi:hypothetical protein